MVATSDLVVTGPTLQQKRTGDVLVVIAGQADAQAAKLAFVLGESAPIAVPVTGIVANATGTQASGTPLNANPSATGGGGGWYSVDTASAVGSSVVLPPAIAGLSVVLTNTTANSIQVYGNATNGDKINGVATATGVAQAAGVTANYLCFTSGPGGLWRRVQSS